MNTNSGATIVAPAIGAAVIAGATLVWLSTPDRAAATPGLVALEQPLAHDQAAPDVARFPVHINRPDGPPTIDITENGATVATLACSLCHSVREPDPRNRTPKDLTDFHQDTPFSHGALTCLSCHNPDDYDTLRLADQTPVDFSDVMTLCAQCHGPQARDYAHGAHGGMNGYWDLTRGPRTRNNCADCHDPHAPQFPAMNPTFVPRDRFLTPADTGAEDTHD